MLDRTQASTMREKLAYAVKIPTKNSNLDKWLRAGCHATQLFLGSPLSSFLNKEKWESFYNQ